MSDDLHNETQNNVTSEDSLFRDIDISNDFMFSYVFRDPKLCIELLGYLLPDRKICQVKYLTERGEEIDATQVEPQKTLDGAFDKRRVRLDVYVDDGTQIIDVEMQVAEKKHLPQRARLYQAHIDINQLGRGRNYDELRPSFVIFICKFDPFGQGLYRYSFENRCAEDGQLLLRDETYKLFFNTTGTKGDISPKLRSLLQYMNDTSAYAVEQTDCELIRKIDRAVSMAKMDDEWRHAYMMYQIQERDAELRGEKRGELRGISKGAQNARIENAKAMLLDHLSVERVAKFSGLPIEQVLAIKAQLAAN